MMQLQKASPLRHRHLQLNNHRHRRQLKQDS
jgi:hypothetical protein